MYMTAFFYRWESEEPIIRDLASEPEQTAWHGGCTAFLLDPDLSTNCFERVCFRKLSQGVLKGVGLAIQGGAWQKVALVTTG